MIEREQWQRIDALLERLLETEPDAREALFAAEKVDEDTRQLLLNMLNSEAMPSRLDETPLLHNTDLLGALHRRSSEATQRGQTVGVYTLDQCLSRSGVAEVYTAHRSDGQAEQRVAIKWLTAAHRDSHWLQRFERERRILAALSHPNIAQLLDLGSSDDGRPYFVMECIEGAALDAHCIDARPDLRAALQLWLQIADAVEYAHRHALIHRDIKPANVMVDGHGQVKLLDFGIAKVLSEQDNDQAQLTRTGLRPMTLPYASPEQIAEAPISTTTDVYQLGVLLYWLLTGCLPHRVQGDRRMDWEQAILHVLPDKPSAALAAAQSADTAQEWQPPWTSTRLRGDLDAIALKALMKEPESRFASVAAMSADVRRHLRGEAVLARPGGHWYRTRRWLQRHPGLSISSAVGIAALSALLTYHIHTLGQARDEALAAAEKQQQIAQFMADIFRAGNPEVSGDRAMTAVELLKNGADQISEKLQDQPAILASIQQEIALGLWTMNQLDDAETLYLASLENLTISGAGDKELAEIHQRLGSFYEEQKEYEKGLHHLNTSLQLRRTAKGLDPLKTAYSLHDLAHLNNRMGRKDIAKSLYSEALQIKRKHAPPGSTTAASTLVNLALLLKEEGAYETAEEMTREAIALYKANPDTLPAHLAATLTNLGSLLRIKGDFENALVALLEAKDIKIKMYGANHPRLGSTFNTLAATYAEMKRFDAAREWYQKAIDAYTSIEGVVPLNTATPMTNLAHVEIDEGHLDRAIELFQRALQIRSAELPDDNSRVLTVRIGLAWAWALQGDMQQAIPLIQTVVEQLNSQPENTTLLPYALLTQAKINSLTGQHAMAEPVYQSALQSRVKLFGADHFKTAEYRLELAKNLLRQDKVAQAHATLEQLMQHHPTHPLADQARSLMASL